MVDDPAGRGFQPFTVHRRLAAWLWAKRIWIAATIAIVFALATAYVVWAVQDLPNPNQDVLAAVGRVPGVEVASFSSVPRPRWRSAS